jgi:hypothetical protein
MCQIRPPWRHSSGMLAVFAEFERDILRDRVIEGKMNGERMVRDVQLMRGGRIVALSPSIAKPSWPCNAQGLLGMDALRNCLLILGDNQMALTCDRAPEAASSVRSLMGNIAGHLSWERVLTSDARVRGILQGAPAKVPRLRLTRLRSVIPDVEVASKNFPAFPQILKLDDLRTTTL